MRSILPLLVTAAFLCACSSRGDLQVESGTEDYTGPKTAAVTPVFDQRTGQGAPDERLGAEVQRSIQRKLDESGIFAGVVTLDLPEEGNEAEVIIEPSLVGPVGRNSDDVELRVRVTEKTKHRVVLNQRYEGGGGPTSALNVAVSGLEDDLANRYGR